MIGTHGTYLSLIFEQSLRWRILPKLTLLLPSQLILDSLRIAFCMLIRGRFFIIGLFIFSGSLVRNDNIMDRMVQVLTRRTEIDTCSIGTSRRCFRDN